MQFSSMAINFVCLINYYYFCSTKLISNYLNSVDLVNSYYSIWIFFSLLKYEHKLHASKLSPHYFLTQILPQKFL